MQAGKAGLEEESRIMHRGFGGTAFEPVEEPRDRELTLGPVSLTFLAIVLCGICALCFVWGYSVGHGATVAAQLAPQVNPEAVAAQPLSGQPKPAASENLQSTAAAQSATTPAPTATSATAPAVVLPTPGSVPSGGAVVQTSLPQPTAAAQPASTGRVVQPALGQYAPWTVQIAAVSHQEDADVLVSALRKRGYAVSSHLDPGDNLIHVQVGSFSTHAEADSMRQRLLNDGYNAIIQP